MENSPVWLDDYNWCLFICISGYTHGVKFDNYFVIISMAILLLQSCTFIKVKGSLYLENYHHCFKLHDIFLSPLNSAVILTFCFLLLVSSTAEHDVLNGECLKTTWSIISRLFTKDCRTDAHDWLAGLRAEQLLNKRTWHKFTSSKLWVSSFELSCLSFRQSFRSRKHRTYLLNK